MLAHILYIFLTLRLGGNFFLLNSVCFFNGLLIGLNMYKLISLSMFFILTSEVVLSKTLSARDFISDPDIMDLAISPDGRYLASIWNDETTRKVMVQDLEKQGVLVGKVDGTAIRPYALEWANNHRLLVTTQIPHKSGQVEEKIAGDESVEWSDIRSAYRIFAMDPNGGNRKILLSNSNVSKKHPRAPLVQHLLPKQKDYILLMAPAKKKGYSLYRTNIMSGVGEKVASGHRRTIGFGVEENGRVRYRYDFGFPLLTVFELVEGKWRKRDKIKFKKEGEVSERLEEIVGVFGEGQLAYRERNEKTGFYRIMVRKGEETKVLVEHTGKDIEGLIKPSFSNRVAGYWIEEGGVLTAEYFDEKLSKKSKVINRELKDIGFSGFRFSLSELDAGYSVVRTFGPDDPGSYFLFNNRTEKLQFFGFSKSTITADQLGVPSVAKFNTRDGYAIESYIIFPTKFKKGKRYPTIVLPHGGPHARDYAIYDRLAQFLATRGYLVIKPNFRGSSGYGREFELAGYKQWGGKMQDDLDDALDFLGRKGFADLGRVCMVGGSYGGYAALISAMDLEKKYKCAVSINGVTHLPAFLEHDGKYFQYFPEIFNEIKRSIGDPKQDRDMLRLNSPALNADKIHARVLLIGGEEDTRVPFSQQSRMAKALKKHKKDYEFIKFKKMGHYLYHRKQDSIDIFEAIERFLSDSIGLEGG